MAKRIQYHIPKEYDIVTTQKEPVESYTSNSK
jgi:hypothetical protein